MQCTAYDETAGLASDATSCLLKSKHVGSLSAGETDDLKAVVALAEREEVCLEEVPGKEDISSRKAL